MPRRPKSPRPDTVPARSADYVESFPPSLGSDCRVLVLGSMPGVRSLAQAQYYAHPQNQFWPLMQALFGVGRELPYAQRLRRLNDVGVGLWDVLQGCERRGSLDSDIAPDSEVANAIPALLQQHAEIRALAFNGGKAAQAFRRHVLAQLPTSRAVQLLTLPSTSPAHAGMRPHEKLRRWSVLRPLLGLPLLPEALPEPRS